MKRLIIITLVFLFTASAVTVYAAGGKNQGTTGTGTTSTGTGAPGTASQPRTGR
ncbi:hypothetical protein ACFLZ5_08630 [Thermodesulfobacteriota bacterium]